MRGAIVLYRLRSPESRVPGIELIIRACHLRVRPRSHLARFHANGPHFARKVLHELLEKLIRDRSHHATTETGRLAAHGQLTFPHEPTDLASLSSFGAHRKVHGRTGRARGIPTFANQTQRPLRLIQLPDLDLTFEREARRPQTHCNRSLIAPGIELPGDASARHATRNGLEVSKERPHHLHARRHSERLVQYDLHCFTAGPDLVHGTAAIHGRSYAACSCA